MAGSDEGAFTATPDPLPVAQGVETSYDLSWTGLIPTPATSVSGVRRILGHTLVRVSTATTLER